MISYKKHSIAFAKELENKTYTKKIFNHLTQTWEKVTYIDDIFCFDIEVSSFFNVNGIWKTAKYESLENIQLYTLKRLAIPYIWQFGINDKIFYGRELKTFKIFIEELLKYVKGKIIIYVHNLPYEFAFINEFFELNNIFANEERKPIYCHYKDKIEFRCSYKLSNLALSNIAKSYNFISASKTHGLDYTEQFLPCTPLNNKQLEYCEHDIIIMYQYLKFIKEQYGHVADIPYTQTSRVRNIIKNDVLNDKQHLATMKRIKPNYEVYRLLTRVFRGGITGCNWTYLGNELHNIFGADISSSYPTVMCLEEFPCGEFKKGNTDFFNEKYRYIYHIKINDLRVSTAWGYISPFKSEKFEKYEEQDYLDCVEGRIQSAKKVELWVTDVDLAIIKLCYDYSNIEYIEYYRSIKGYLPLTLIKYILSLYQEKTALKGNEEANDLYQELKERFNGIFGMSVTNLVHNLIEYCGNNKWNTKKLNAQEISDELDKINPFLFYAWGVWTTAFGRKNLFTVLLAIGNQGVYVDTDSIKFVGKNNYRYMERYNKLLLDKIQKVCKKRKIDPALFTAIDYNGEEHTLGLWEFDPPIFKFKSIGSKKYIYTDKKGFHVVIAGCKKSYYDFNKNKEIETVPENYNYFNEHAVFENARTVSWYTSNQPQVVLTDYLGNKYVNTQKNGIVTLNVPYSCGLATNTQKYLERPHNGLSNYLRMKL